MSKITTKILRGFRRKKKTAAIYFDSIKCMTKSKENTHILKTRKYGNTGKNDGVHKRTDW